MPWPKGLVNDVWLEHIFTFTHLKLVALIWQFISSNYLPFSEGGSNPYITYYIFLNRSLWSTKSVWQNWIVLGRWYMFQYKYVSTARYTYLTYLINISSSAALLPYHNMYLKDTRVNVFLNFWGNTFIMYALGIPHTCYTVNIDWLIFINILHTPVETITNAVELCKNVTKNFHLLYIKPLSV